MVEPGLFRQALDRIRQINPKMIFSAHLPPARGKSEQFLELLAKVPTSTPFVTPDQKALEQILAQIGERPLTSREPSGGLRLTFSPNTLSTTIYFPSSVELLLW